MDTVFSIFRAHADSERAQQMSAYMKGKFPFLGLPTPLRRDLSKSCLKQAHRTDRIDWSFVFNCFEQPEREFQYLALDYLNGSRKHLACGDIDAIQKLIQTKSWWDSVDGLDQVVGYMILAYPELKNSHVRQWMISDDIWLRRIAIDCQLNLKSLTDTTLLADTIVSSLGSKEFFVNKAIGWSLRDFSKTDPAWVRSFMQQNLERLHPLSIREGSKYL